MTITAFSLPVLGTIAFLGFVLITIVGALIAVLARRLIRAVAGLALCFTGLGGLFYFLDSPFLALMAILIYIGAVCITIMFGIMLAEGDALAKPTRHNTLLTIGAIPAATAILWAFTMIAVKAPWPRATTSEHMGSVEQIGRALLSTYSLAFEMISLVLLAAILGALVVAREGRNKS
ncbi:MAG: NADH-quinone oxidoreductase subunit J [Spirochaetes bacterium]|nr:NADH-quinone oxidoreductase subunit J [Spirochaetota bacterium]